MKVNYELSEKIGATHYDSRDYSLLKVDRGVLLVYSETMMLWARSGMSVGMAALHVKGLPPKHTRTEYEKVTESIFDLRDEFERGELYFKCSEGEWVQAVHESEVVHFLNDCGLYRKVEKEVDWHEDVVGYLSNLVFCEIDLSKKLPLTVAHQLDGMIWSNVTEREFLELCRVALRASGELD